MSEFLISEAARLVAAHERDFVRAIIGLAVAQASRVGSDGVQRSVSVRAIAQSLSLPYETTRRKVLELEERGYCRRVSAQRVAAICAPHTGGAAAANDRSLLEALEQVVADLKTLGFDLDQIVPRAAPRSPNVGPPSEAVIRNLVDDFILRVLESGVTPHGSMLDALVYTALMNFNAEPITLDPTMAWRYSGSDTPPPDNVRRPVTIAELASRLFIPRETMRRHITRMLELDRCIAVPGGYLASMSHMQAPGSLEAGMKVNQYFSQLLGHLRQEGVDFDAIPARVSPQGAVA